jgi:hypothetical protein
MRVAIMQPYFFPYIGYFQLINMVDVFIFYDDVNYIKGGWVNRNRIQINGSPSFFSVQTDKSSPYKKIYDIKLSANPLWRKKLLKSVYFAYKRSKYFDIIYPIIESTFNYDTNLLSELNKKSIINFCEYLNIKTIIFNTSSVFKNQNLHGQNRVIDICDKINASVYVNAINGKELYSKLNFEQKNINLKFIKMDKINYNNLYLSIIDITMNNSKEEVQKMLLKCCLI